MAESSSPPAFPFNLISAKPAPASRRPHTIVMDLSPEKVDALAQRVSEATGKPEAGRQIQAMAQQILDGMEELERTELTIHRLTREAEARGLLPAGSAAARLRRWR